MEILATNIANIKESKQLLYKMTVSAGQNVQKMTEEQRAKSYPVDVYVLTRMSTKRERNIRSFLSFPARKS